MPSPRQHPFHLRFLQGALFRREVRASIDIAAPIDVVWRLLTNVDDYPSWNSFTPRVDTPGLAVGNHVELHVRMPGRGPRVQREWVNLVDPPHALCWGLRWGHPAVFVGNRWQVLEAIDDSTTRYVTYDRFSGVLAPIVIASYGRAIQAGFELCARDLRNAAEARAGDEASP